MENTAMNDFTVIGHYEENGQIFCDHVKATSGPAAFAEAAKERPTAVFTVALKGKLTEGTELTFSGESLVDADTILSQTDVFC